MSLKAGRSGINNNLVDPVDGTLLGIFSADQVNDLIKDVYADAGVVGAKNRLPILSSVVSDTINGVTFTVTRNAAGEVTEIDANGTANSSGVNLVLFQDLSNSCPFNSFILSGCTGGSSSTYDLRVSDITTGASPNYNGDTVVNVSSTGRWNVQIVIRANKTVNHVKFYPMLRLATDTDNTYQPYSMTNQELTALKANKADLPIIVPFSISANSSVTLNVSDGTCVEFKGFGLAASMFDLITFVRANHTVEVDDIYKGTNITYTKAANAITIANGAAGVVTGYALIYVGTVSVAS